MIVPRRHWTRLTDLVDELDRNYWSAAYVFRNNYFFLDLPTAPNETVNITYVRYRRKVWTAFTEEHRLIYVSVSLSGNIVCRIIEVTLR